MDSEIVGSDSEAELMGTLVLRGADLLAATRFEWAAEGSALDLGDVENSWLRRFDFAGFFVKIPPFSAGDEDGEELLEKVLDSRRVIARIVVTNDSNKKNVESAAAAQ